MYEAEVWIERTLALVTGRISVCTYVQDSYLNSARGYKIT